MSQRPEILFPLFSTLTSLDGVGPKTAEKLAQLELVVPRDLLLHLPHAMIDRRLRTSLDEVPTGQHATIPITVVSHRPPAKRTGAYRIFTRTQADEPLELIYFHAKQSYLTSILPLEAQRVVSGKFERFENRVQIAHPDYVTPMDQVDTIPQVQPVYPLTHGVSAKMMHQAVQGARLRVPSLSEWIDPHLLAKRHWPSWSEAITSVHEVTDTADLSPLTAARQRLAYDEFFAHQVTLALARERRRAQKGRPNPSNGALASRAIAQLPYVPTGAQTRAVHDICADLASDRRMNRLLQGDVGSGKTLVAILALLHAIEGGGQGVLMAPTEILVRQHAASFEDVRALGVEVETLTGRDTGRARAQKLDRLAKGDIQILLGTHSVFQEGVDFADLRLAIIDEQHRFGVAQRLSLGAKGEKVDILVMTATPIPRSLALAQYGDMDVSILDEKPPGRKPVTTSALPKAREADLLARLDEARRTGAQIYWVCPLVEESEVLRLQSAVERYKNLCGIYGPEAVALVHGQQHPDEKDAQMRRFVTAEAQILVATTVIEVGVNVPSATIMIIENAEHFGLAQLHQLRGRVGRGSDASHCILFYEGPLSKSATERLRIMRESEDGFVIAQKDLEMRGAGDVLGTVQSGLPRFRVASVESQADLLQLAQSDARALIAKDPELSSERGQATRNILWLLDHDQSIKRLKSG